MLFRSLGPAQALIHSIKEVYFVSAASLKYIGTMIKGTGDSSQLGGPIRIAKITGQVAEIGILPFISIMAYISISLGLINLFPIPMLDGGHLMFYAFENLLSLFFIISVTIYHNIYKYCSYVCNLSIKLVLFYKDKNYRS